MAEQKYYTIVTDLGAELMAKAAQKGQKVNVVSIAAGDGDGVFYTPTSDMTALKREIWRGEIQNYEIDSVSRNVMKISGIIPKEVGHFVLREMALFDDNNNMIAVCNAPDLLKAVLEEGALTEAVVYMRIAVTNTEAVNIVVNSSAIYATVQDLDAHKNDDNAHKKLFDEKVDKTEFITELNKKVDKTEFTTELNKKVDNTEFTTELSKKVDKTDFTGENIGELLEAAGWQSGGDMTDELDLKANKNLDNVEKSSLDDKVTINKNVALGSGALNNITAVKYNVAIGENALNAIQTGGYNVALGYAALGLCENGEANIAIGDEAAVKLKQGSQNIAIGSYVLKKATTCNCNTAIGTSTMLNNETGQHNTAIGVQALLALKTGNNNTAIGNMALTTIQEGDYNTAIGYQALTALGANISCSNCTGLGANATVTGSNQVQLGNTNVTVYAQTAVQTRSDARDKVEIQDTVLGLDFIKKLTPRQFKMNSRELYFEQDKQSDYTAKNDGSKAGKRFHQGFVAQEVKQVIDEIGVDFAGYQDHKINGGEDVLSLGYTEFIAPIVKAIQQQQHIIEQLQQRVTILEQNGGVK